MFFATSRLACSDFVIRVKIRWIFHSKGALVTTHYCGERYRPFGCDIPPTGVFIKPDQPFCPIADEADL